MSTLFGAYDDNLRQLESLLNVRIRTQGHELLVEGDAGNTAKVARLVEQLGGLIDEGHSISDRDVKTAAQLVAEDAAVDLRDHFLKDGQVRTAGKRRIAAKSANQRRYLEAIDQYDIVFGIGPAGTGKTYLAMAQAVSYLLAKKVSRIVLVRPAVEAGEKLGFLPGDLQEKVNPYLRPLYDALYDMLDVEKAEKYLERGAIEVAPLAFMRGRTLNDAFVILDEAQNTTTEQMKMFLTRLGFGSKAVVTGDVTQIDLPGGRIVGSGAGHGSRRQDRGHLVRLLRRARRRAAQARASDREGIRRLMAAARLRVSVATPDGLNAATREGSAPWLARIAPARARGDLSVAIVSDRRMRALNRQFRGKDKVTDVLSFPVGMHAASWAIS